MPVYKQKVLITGGAGFLGINLIRFLIKKGYEIRSLDIAPFDYSEKSEIESILGDIREKGTVEKAMKGVDVVVHCAAALPLYSDADIRSTDIDGTKNIIDAAEKAKVKMLVHISSTAVYGVPDHHPIMEEDQLIGVGAYGEAKIKAEEICLEARKRGMIVPILRPKSFIGPERLGVFALLYDWAKDGKNFPILGNGKNKYQLLDVQDLCEAIYSCLTLDSQICNDTFNIAAKDFTGIKEDFQHVLDKAGFGKRIISFPAKPAIIFLKLLEKLGVSPLYKWVYETAYKDSFVSTTKAEKKLGFSPQFSNKEALARNYKWYLENSKDFENKNGISHRVPWKQGALKFLKHFF